MLLEVICVPIIIILVYFIKNNLIMSYIAIILGYFYSLSFVENIISKKENNILKMQV